MRNDNKRGSTVLIVVIILGTLGLMGAMVSHRLSTDVHRQLIRAMAGHELEHLCLQALEEAHYKFAIGDRPYGSRQEAAAWLKGAVARKDPASPIEDPLPPGLYQGKVMDGDANAFLRDSSSVAYLPPVAVAGTIAGDPTVDVEPVAVRVVDRVLGKWAKASSLNMQDPSGSQLRKLGLPLLLQELRTVWGIVEFKAVATARKGRSVKVQRTATCRKLFLLADYAYQSGKPGSYGYIFPESVGRTLSRERS